MKVGDTAFYSNGYMVLEELNSGRDVPGIEFVPNDSVVVAAVKVTSKNATSYTTHALLMAESLVLQLQKTEGNTAQLGVKESNAVLKYVTLKAYKFPFINLVWAGTLIMVIGFFISALHRRERRKILNKGQEFKKEERKEAVA